ncbi:hypothetical protein IQ241_00510 [Romeria aff. gracilis LEGE 07310]|uniref:Uncharacterized protein n=1 Tax=Vasconcelosia minhoensis LEGE 07310 TaxID=915328 RepID=A0A8J7A9R9_9CYAN|nr:hypothetical protein [Romeria gracilis]MBE9075794.1 hypothetical protein [Romeria aff. gracilis LEGE 07310]
MNIFQDQRLWLLYLVVAVVVGLAFGRAQWQEQSQQSAYGLTHEPDMDAWLVVAIAAIGWPIVLPISLVEQLKQFIIGRKLAREARRQAKKKR